MPELQVHGTPDYQELAALGWTPADVAIFSSNINPYGPPPRVVEAVQAAATQETIATYPDRFSAELRQALAELHRVEPEAILVGNGTADIMWLLAHACAGGRRAVILEPTFSEYRNSLSMVAARITSVACPGWEAATDHRFRQSDRTLRQCAAAISAATPEMVFVCNPNNPTGRSLTPDELGELHTAAPAALWVIDEAYADFTAAPWSAAGWAAQGGWIVLRSMTKDFALGGLRVGYLIAEPELTARLYAAQPPWNVNNLAQIGGRAACREIAWRERTTGLLREHVDALQAALRAVGFAPLPTAVNYFLLPVGNGALLRKALLTERLIVRDCASFGLPEMIRIAMQLPEQNARLTDALCRLAPSAG